MRIGHVLFLLIGIVVVAGLVFLAGGGLEPPRPDEPGDRGPTGGPRPDEPGPAVAGVAAEIRGVVVDPEDRPVPDARVVLLPEATEATAEEAERVLPTRVVEALLYAAEADERPLRLETAGPGASEPPLATTTTGASGEFRFAATVGRRYRLQASAEELSMRPTSGVRAGDRVTLRLVRGTALTGVVQDEDGEPVAGVVVDTVDGDGEAVTDGDGGFVLGGLAAGGLTVRLRHEEFATSRVVLSLPAAGLRRTFRLGRGVTVDVLVELWGEDDDDPAAGATVALVAADTGELHRTTTGADGKARIPGLPVGRYDAVAHLDGWIPHVLWNQQVTADRRLAFSLEPEAISTIRVLGPDGSPLQGARFLLANVDEEIDSRISRVVGETDAKGVFRFAFDDDRRSVLWVTYPGMAAGYVEPDDPAEPEEITVILRRGAGIEGVVVDSNGRPIAGATIYVDSYHDDADDDVTMTVVTDEQGRFQADGLHQGEVEVEVDAEGFLGEDVEIEHLVPGAPALRIVLQSGAEIRGRVVSRTGDGVPGVRVSAPASSNDTVATGADGSFRLGGIPERRTRGQLRLHLRHGPLAWSTHVTAGTEVLVTVPEAVTLRGRVLAKPAGTPVTTYRLEVRSPELGHISVEEVNNPDGQFEIVAPDMPDIEIRIVAQERSEWTQRLDRIGPSERETLTIHLDMPPRVTVRTIGANGTPVLAARVVVQAVDGSWTHAAVTNATGTATILAQAGEARVVVAHRDLLGAIVGPIRLEPGVETKEEVSLLAGGTVRIRVEGPDGALGVTRFARQVVGRPGQERCVLTGTSNRGTLRVEITGPGVIALRYVAPRVENGEIVLRGLPAGSFRAQAILGSNRGAPASFQMGAGAGPVVDLSVGR